MSFSDVFSSMTVGALANWEVLGYSPTLDTFEVVTSGVDKYLLIQSINYQGTWATKNSAINQILDSLDNLRIQCSRPNQGYLTLGNGNAQLLIGSSGFVEFLVGGNTTTLAIGVAVGAKFEARVSGAVGNRVLSVSDASGGGLVQATIDDSGYFSYSNPFELRWSVGSNIAEPMHVWLLETTPQSTPGATTIYPCNWQLLLTGGSRFILPETFKSTQETPIPVFQIAVSRIGAPIIPTNLVSRVNNAFRASFYGSGQLPDEAYDFKLEGLYSAGNAESFESYVQSINVALMDTVRLERHLEGSVFSVPVDTTAIGRSTAYSHALIKTNFGTIKTLIRLNSRNWRNDATMQQLGVIF
jgi:hypothetical protein